MEVAHEVADEAAFGARCLGACLIGDAGGEDDGVVCGLSLLGEAGHGIDEPDKAVIEDGGGFEQSGQQVTHGASEVRGWGAITQARARLQRARAVRKITRCFGP